MRRDHPLIFSAPMIRALAARRKSQTRRILGPGNTCLNGHRWRKWERGEAWDWQGAWVDDGPSPAGNPGPYLKLPYAGDDPDWIGTVHRAYPNIQPGDRIWVKEVWNVEDVARDALERAAYRATDVPPSYLGKVRWRPPIFMPRRFSRFTLAVTAVRVQRVHDISEDDAEAEGVRLGDWERRTAAARVPRATASASRGRGTPCTARAHSSATSGSGQFRSARVRGISTMPDPQRPGLRDDLRELRELLDASAEPVPWQLVRRLFDVLDACAAQAQELVEDNRRLREKEEEWIRTLVALVEGNRRLLAAAKPFYEMGDDLKAAPDDAVIGFLPPDPNRHVSGFTPTRAKARALFDLVCEIGPQSGAVEGSLWRPASEVAGLEWHQPPVGESAFVTTRAPDGSLYLINDQPPAGPPLAFRVPEPERNKPRDTTPPPATPA